MSRSGSLSQTLGLFIIVLGRTVAMRPYLICQVCISVTSTISVGYNWFSSVYFFRCEVVLERLDPG